MREHSAGVVIYRRREDGKREYLLLQAAAGCPWGFAKGKLEAGESEEEAALREVAEETGLGLTGLAAGFRERVGYRFRRKNTVVEKTVVYFVGEADEGEVVMSSEHVAFQWLTFRKAKRMLSFANARRLIERAHEFVAGDEERDVGEGE